MEERQLVDRLRELIAAPRKIELDRHAHLVTNVVDIALDRLGRDLDRFCELCAIEVSARLNGVEDFLKPLEQRAGMQGAWLPPPQGLRRDKFCRR